MGVADRTRKNNPYVIEIGPSAMINASELANTIAHELNHVRSYAKGFDALESTAYSSGDNLSKYIRGEK